MSFITPFFLSSVQKQLAPSNRNASNDDIFAETHEIYHDGSDEGQASLFIPKTPKVSLNRINMAPLKSQVLDSLNQFNLTAPKAQPGAFTLPDEL